MDSQAIESWRADLRSEIQNAAADDAAVSEPAVLKYEAPQILQELLIIPRSGWIGVNWKELFDARELLYFLVWRDVSVRYKETILGVAWAVLQPLLTMLIFAFIFGRFAGTLSEGQPYPLFVLAGLVPWTFFATSVTQGGQSLINQQSVISKVYFPRLFVPTAAVGVALVDMAASLGLYVIMLLWYRTAPNIGIVLLPLALLMLLTATLGFAYTLSALTVRYRDFRILSSFIVQVMMYLSPVIYPAELLTRRYQVVLALNPMFGIIEAFRSAILGTPWKPGLFCISSMSAAVILIFGVFYFRRTERFFADIA